MMTQAQFNERVADAMKPLLEKQNQMFQAQIAALQSSIADLIQSEWKKIYHEQVVALISTQIHSELRALQQAPHITTELPVASLHVTPLFFLSIRAAE